ncbi:MAG: hypothetical protein JKY09_08435 [Crocinitomicaceae bacterium]|nr:hypothetical protein [Crocinitomicaceae bacterium]
MNFITPKELLKKYPDLKPVWEEEDFRMLLGCDLLIGRINDDDTVEIEERSLLNLIKFRDEVVLDRIRFIQEALEGKKVTG